MITIRPHGTFINGFTVDGHAGFGEHGQDIVCASVSVVTQMIAFELNYKGYASYKMKEGSLIVSIDVWSMEDPYVEGLIDMMKRTLGALASSYPEHITMKEED